jgi:dihydroorotase
MPALTIRNGRVIDPANGIDRKTDITLERGKVAKVGRVSRPAGAVFDASGCIVCPGLIDPHVHLREPGQEDKETIATGTAAAISGGFTTVVCMPNTAPAIDDDARVDFVYWQAGRTGQCHVYPTGAVTKARAGEELAEIGLMSQAGAVAFTDDGDAIASAATMAKALTYVKMTGKAILQHCEEPTLVAGGAMNAGALATRLGLPGRPAVAEDLIVQRDIMLNASIGCRYHVQHMSTEASVELVRRAQTAGQPITGELTPHHLLLTEDACAGYDPNYRMNPPLRTRRDIAALLAGAADGVISILGTDHAPHTREEKELEFASAPAGIIGLECALPLYIRALIETDTIDWPAMIAMMTINPAKLYGLEGKGTLGPAPGSADADVTIIDPAAQWTIDVDTFAGKSRNCPFDGWPVTGRAIATIVAGKIKLNRDSQRLRR